MLRTSDWSRRDSMRSKGKSRQMKRDACLRRKTESSVSVKRSKNASARLMKKPNASRKPSARSASQVRPLDATLAVPCKVQVPALHQSPVSTP